MLLEQYAKDVYERGYKDGLKKFESIREMSPLILRFFCFLLSILVILTPYAITFLIYPIIDLIFESTAKRKSNAQQEENRVEVAETE